MDLKRPWQMSKQTKRILKAQAKVKMEIRDFPQSLKIPNATGYSKFQRWTRTGWRATNQPAYRLSSKGKLNQVNKYQWPSTQTTIMNWERWARRIRWSSCKTSIFRQCQAELRRMMRSLVRGVGWRGCWIRCILQGLCLARGRSRSLGWFRISPSAPEQQLSFTMRV